MNRDDFPTILVSRRPRRVGEDWTGARSWFGGAPKLGGAPWPRDTKGAPLHFVAQIDLAELAAVAGRTLLPRDGALAFFVGGPGAVLHVPRPGRAPLAAPPADTADLTSAGAGERWRRDLDGRPLFPYWPIDFTALDLGAAPDDDDDGAVDAYYAAQKAAIEKRFSRRETGLSAAEAFKGPPFPDYWRIAIQLANDLAAAARWGQGSLKMWEAKLSQARAAGDAVETAKAQSAIDRLTTELAAKRAANLGFGAYVAEVAQWIAGRDPWAIMAPQDVARLTALWKRNTEFPDLTGYRGIGGLDWLKDKTLKALPQAGSADYAALPAPVRSLIDAHRAPQPMWGYAAVTYARDLERAIREGIPRAAKSLDDHLRNDRAALEKLKASGAEKAAEIAKLETLLGTRERLQSELPAKAAAFRFFAAGFAAHFRTRDLWSRLTDAEVDRLKSAIDTCKKEFDDFTRYIAPSRIEDLQTETINAMLTGPERAYAALPETVRARVNRDYLLPPGCWHQMFGRGVEIQGESGAMREEGNLMLLQLSYDYLMQWSFGDCGAFQFWIQPKDLKRGNWKASQATFECH